MAESFRSTASIGTGKSKSVQFDTASVSSEYEESITSIIQFNAELALQENAIKLELHRVSKCCNLLLCMIYGLLCLNWYIIGSQWLMHKPKIPEIQCSIDDLNGVKWTLEETRNITTPNSIAYVSGCVYYDHDYYYISSLSYEDAHDYVEKYKDKTKILFCELYTIIKDVPNEVSFVKEFKLICFKKAFQRNEFYMAIGQAFLAFPSGVLADMYGRKPVHVVCSILASAMSFLLPLTLHFGMFALARTIQGGCIACINVMLHLTYTEICRRRYRAISTMCAFGCFIIGSGQNIGINALADVWRLRLLILGLLLSIDLYGAVMFVPESPRYLLVKRQFNKAWDVLEELGSTQVRPQNVEDYSKINASVGYQLKILTRRYLIHRVIIVLSLNSAGVYYYYVFRNMSLKVMLMTDTLKIQMALVAVSLLIATAIILIPKYTTKTIICIYFVLLALCFMGRIIADGGVLLDLTSLAGIMLSNILFIITFTFMIDIFPTTHRGTILGFSLSMHFLVGTIVDVFEVELKLDEESKYLNAFYCVMCLMCASITLISPDADSEIPDTKHDLFRKLSLESLTDSSSSN